VLGCLRGPSQSTASVYRSADVVSPGIGVPTGVSTGRSSRGIRIYVTASKSADGFVDSSRTADSAADIRSILSDKKHTESIVLVDREEAADLILEVKFSGYVAVGTEIDTQIRKGTFGGIDSTTTTEAKTLPGIGAILRVRGSDYSKELSFVQQMFWKDLARRIVYQLDSWIDANGKQLQK
jgi:hypothetical protein